MRDNNMQSTMRTAVRTAIYLGAMALAGASALAHATVEVQFWHAMSGALGDRVNDLATRFNAQQKEYKVVPVFKGSYDETLAAGIAAFRAKSPPHNLRCACTMTDWRHFRQRCSKWVILASPCCAG